MYTGGKDCALIRWDVETGKKALPCSADLPYTFDIHILYHAFLRHFSGLISETVSRVIHVQWMDVRTSFQVAGTASNVVGTSRRRRSTLVKTVFAWLFLFLFYIGLHIHHYLSVFLIFLHSHLYISLLISSRLCRWATCPGLEPLPAGAAGIACLRWRGPSRTILGRRGVWLLDLLGYSFWNSIRSAWFLHNFAMSFRVFTALHLGSFEKQLGAQLAYWPVVDPIPSIPTARCVSGTLARLQRAAWPLSLTVRIENADLLDRIP